MKIGIIVLILGLVSGLAQANTKNLSQLGNLTEYTCIVEIESGFGNNGGVTDSVGLNLYQTCNENNPREVIGSFFETSTAQLQIMVIKQLRPDFTLISSSGNDENLKMIFQKK